MTSWTFDWGHAKSGLNQRIVWIESLGLYLPKHLILPLLTKGKFICDNEVSSPSVPILRYCLGFMSILLMFWKLRGLLHCVRVTFLLWKEHCKKQFCVTVQRVGYSLIWKPKAWPWGTETADIVQSCKWARARSIIVTQTYTGLPRSSTLQVRMTQQPNISLNFKIEPFPIRKACARHSR